MKISSNTLFFTFLIVVFISVESYSQCYSRGARGSGGRSSFSIELGAGMPFPVSPSNDLKFGDAKKGELGLRYLPEGSNFGLRGYYGYASLSDSGAEPSNHTNKLLIHRVELQGIYMLDDLIGISNNSIFELESYLGVGAALGKPSSVDNKNKMIAATIGVRPRFLLDGNRFYVYLDTSYGMLFNQKYNYSGEYIPGSTKSDFGSMAQVSIGFSYRL